jgi:hypothetical protein
MPSNLYPGDLYRSPDFIEFQLNTAAASTTSYQSVLWSTTPTAKTGFTSYSPSQWSGSSFTPGILGTYLIVWNWNANGGNGTAPVNNGEIIIIKNLSTANAVNAYATSNMLATALTTTTNYENTCGALFTVTNVADYVNFVFNSNTSSNVALAGTVNSTNFVLRNFLRITKL